MPFRGGPSGRSLGTHGKPLFLSPEFLSSGFVAALRPPNDRDLGLFQRTALAVSAALAMCEAATESATAGVSEACAMPEATTKVMCEAVAHAVGEAVAEIAVRARIIRSVAFVIG